MTTLGLQAFDALAKNGIMKQKFLWLASKTVAQTSKCSVCSPGSGLSLTHPVCDRGISPIYLPNSHA